MPWNVNNQPTILSDATTPDHSRPGSDGNKEVLRIPQSSCLTRASPSDCLVLHPGLSLEKSYPPAEMQSVFSTALAEWASELYESTYV